MAMMQRGLYPTSQSMPPNARYATMLHDLLPKSHASLMYNVPSIALYRSMHFVLVMVQYMISLQ